MTLARPPWPLLFFADRLPPLVGGMEMHARFFIEHFASHTRFALETITLDSTGHDARLAPGGPVPLDVADLTVSPAIVFFNSGRWIEDLRALRRTFPGAIFAYRTGGNEILKAQLVREHRPSHAARQAFWAAVLNDTIDLLITNSAFTEERLRALDIKCPFLRCVGGVNVQSFGNRDRAGREPLTMFCAARFVPYKNHGLMLDVVGELARRGLRFQLKIAGAGPLLDEARAHAEALGLSDQVMFLGELENGEVCRETVAADVYIQLSGDISTSVPGGSYVHAEGMGRSILEAISAGTFVIAGRSGALAEIVTPERGLLVDLADAQTIADAIEPVLVRPLPRGGGTDAYGWSTIFETYERSWEELLARPRHH